MTKFGDVLLALPTYQTPLILQVHIVAAHAICSAVEAAMFAARSGELP